MDDNCQLNVEGKQNRSSWKQSLPIGLCSLSRKKYPVRSVPLCEFASALPRHWKDLRICPAVNIVYNLNKSQIVKSLGSLPFDFLRPEWKGHSLYILKVTKTNKQLGYLLVAEGVIESAMWVGNSLLLSGVSCLFICPGHLITELPLKAVARSLRSSWPSAGCAGEHS